MFVSVTRLRLKSWYLVPIFFLRANASLTQAKNADGFLGGALLSDKKFTFWTLTNWRDQEAMRAFMLSGSHKNVMPKLMHWCDEASVVHWMQENALLPDWQEASRRMRAEGRASKLRNPSPNHQALAFDSPRTTNSILIVRN